MTDAELEKIADEVMDDLWQRRLIYEKGHVTVKSGILAALQKVSAMDRAELAKQVDRNAEYLHNLKRLRGAKEVAEAQLAEARKENAKLREELNWQNHRNSGHPTKGGFEFYINEEWTGLAHASIDTDQGWSAMLSKRRYDPDDERVRVGRVAEDDGILSDLTATRAEVERLREVIRGVLDSATPHPIEHPTMFQAFAVARSALAQAGEEKT